MPVAISNLTPQETLETLIHKLDRLPAASLEERQHIQATQAFIATTGEAGFYRTHLAGHVTGSALLLDARCTKILLMHHRALNRWLQFGGHADGNIDVAQVALRETQEESGCAQITLLTDVPIDCDVHTIPASAKKQEPEHVHYDLRYLVRLNQGEIPQQNHESTALKWVDLGDATTALPMNIALKRLIAKCRYLIDQGIIQTDQDFIPAQEIFAALKAFKYNEGV